ncbi:MAG: peptidoglycan-binding protein [Acutalibacteraceae bacterium]
MKKKFIALSLIFALVLCSVFFAGCSNDNNDYPVTVGSITVDECPENIVVLDKNIADIVTCIGYEVKLVGRSKEVNQASLSVVPEMGTEESPDLSSIVKSGAEMVFAGETLKSENIEKLKDKGITAVKLSKGSTDEEILTTFNTLGAFLGGNVTGRDKAMKAYDNLYSSSVATIEGSASGTTGTMSIAYLYLDSSNNLCSYNKKSFVGKVLSYTGAVNIAQNIENSLLEKEILKVSNPDAIVYDTEAVLDYLKGDKTLKNLKALKNKKTLHMDISQISLQGESMLSNITTILATLAPEVVENLDSKYISETVASTSETSVETEAESTAETEATVASAAYELGSKYNVKLNDKTVKSKLKSGENNDYIKAMQKRLIDLGYLANGNSTGYFGDMTASAIKDFQKANSIKLDGKATVKTVKLMFSKDAKSK